MTQNWTPFQPQGWGGTLAGAAVVFFAYIGFDAVSTVAEETKNPSRDLPIGIIASLVVCTVIYVVVAAVFTGLIPYEELKTRLATETAEPLTMGWITSPRRRVGDHHRRLRIGGCAHGRPAGVPTRPAANLHVHGPRRAFAEGVHPRSSAVPHSARDDDSDGHRGGVARGVANINATVDLTNIGTLFAFVLVCIGIPVLRLKDPQRAIGPSACRWDRFSCPYSVPRLAWG